MVLCFVQVAGLAHIAVFDMAFEPGDSIFQSSLGSYTNPPVVVKNQRKPLDGSPSQGPYNPELDKM